MLINHNIYFLRTIVFWGLTHIAFKPTDHSETGHFTTKAYGADTNIGLGNSSTYFLHITWITRGKTLVIAAARGCFHTLPKRIVVTHLSSVVSSLFYHLRC